jgi:hypothetical protein
MNDSTAWQTTHRRLSEHDLKFREMAKDSPEFLDRCRFQALDASPELLHFPLQPWPTFIGREKLEEVGRVSLALNRLLRSVPERVFQRDWAKIAAFYSLGSPTIAEVLFAPPTGAETVVSRGDLIETAQGFKCLEWNFAAALGGWDTAILVGLHRSIPATARFIADEGIRAEFRDPVLEMFRHIFDEVRRNGLAGDGDLSIAFVVQPGGVDQMKGSLSYLDGELRRGIAALGLDLSGRVLVCSYDDIVAGPGELRVGDCRLDVLIEYGRMQTPPHVYRFFKAGRVALFNGPMGTILSTKRNLALLSQYAASGIFSPAERAVIEAHIPWTRLVAPGPVDYEGEVRPLPELLEACRERLVLKDGDSWGGKGVALGRFTPPQEWSRKIETALAEKRWIVQELVESLPYLYQSGDYGCSVHDVVWGPFVFGDRYNGMVLRMQPKASGGPVNLSLAATEGIVFEV